MGFEEGGRTRSSIMYTIRNGGMKDNNRTALMDGVETTVEMGMRRLASPLSEDQGKTSVKERASVRNRGKHRSHSEWGGREVLLGGVQDDPWQTISPASRSHPSDHNAVAERDADDVELCTSSKTACRGGCLRRARPLASP